MGADNSVGSYESILKQEYKFIRDADDDNDPNKLTWEKQIAIKHYSKLYKEFALADFSRYKKGQLGLRWRTEKEVLIGKGESLCGNISCHDQKDLRSYELPFNYKEDGESKMALVKLRVCPECANKIYYINKYRETSK